MFGDDETKRNRNGDIITHRGVEFLPLQKIHESRLSFLGTQTFSSPRVFSPRDESYMQSVSKSPLRPEEIKPKKT